MTPNLLRKLEALAERHEEVGRLLADPGVIADNTRFRNLSREYSQLEPVAAPWVNTTARNTTWPRRWPCAPIRS